MKSLSASIIVLAGAILLGVGSLVTHSDTRLFLQLVGCALGLLGIVVWLVSIKGES